VATLLSVVLAFVVVILEGILGGLLLLLFLPVVAATMLDRDGNSTAGTGCSVAVSTTSLLVGDDDVKVSTMTFKEGKSMGLLLS